MTPRTNPVPRDFLVVFLKDGTVLHVTMSDLDAVRDAMRSYIGAMGWQTGTSDSDDSLVEITSVDGSSIVLLASTIVGYRTRRLAERLLSHAIDEALAREADAAKPTTKDDAPRSVVPRT